jgi:uncharacterized protein YkwD
MIIKRLSIYVFIMMIGPSAVSSQIYENMMNWDEGIIEKANTASEADYLSRDEKMVILYSNLARADGPLFAETFLTEYIRIKNLKSNRYTRSLYSDLKKIRDLPMLIPERDLYDGAREHAIWSGTKGYEGHKGFKDRFEPLLKKYSEVGENIYYGQYTPLEIVIQLLIDEGISDLGHRKNLLNPKFNSIGVAIKPHKDFDYNCVMGFGMVPRSYLDYIE